MKQPLFAKTWWCAVDIENFRDNNDLPAWTTEQCEAFLKSIEDDIMDAMVGAGWEIISDAMPKDE
jgi:hypothetical protein